MYLPRSTWLLIACSVGLPRCHLKEVQVVQEVPSIRIDKHRLHSTASRQMTHTFVTQSLTQFTGVIRPNRDLVRPLRAIKPDSPMYR